MFLLGAVGGGACTNDPRAVTFRVEVEVVDEGEGEEYGEELYPLAAGNKWVFVSTDEPFVAEVTDRRMVINMVHARVVERQTPGGVIESLLHVNEEGVWDHGTETGADVVPVCRLHFPLRVGKQWRLSSEKAGFEMEARVAGEEEVATAMGVFKALRVNYIVTYEDRGTTRTESMWFSPGIGPVQTWNGEHRHLLRYHEIEGFEARRAESRVE